MTDHRDDDLGDPNISPAQTPHLGEDEGGTEHDGGDGHLHDDQRSPASDDGEVQGDDDGRTQDLARAGRPGFDPNDGAE